MATHTLIQAFAFILILAGVGLLVMAWLHRSRLQNMSDTRTYTAAQLNGAPGRGLAGKLVEVKGKVVCSDPAISSESKIPCAIYKTLVEQKVRQRRRELDGDVRSTSNWETVHDIKDARDFYVEDATGRVKVYPSGAETVLEATMDEYASRGLDIMTSLRGYFADEQVVAARRKEEVLRVGSSVYVLGELHFRDGGSSIVIPEGGGRYLISVKSEEELAADSLKRIAWGFYGGVSMIVIGIVIFVVSLAGK